MADNPYAQYAAPEAPRELTIRPKSANPYAEFAAPDTSATQTVGVASRALGPYAAAAGLGAALGAPAGGIGAIPGAIAGAGALGLADIGTGAYNLIAPQFGGARIPSGSEAIRNLMARGGMGRTPQTPEQEMLFSALEGGAGALSGVGAAKTIGSMVQNPTAQRVANFFAAQPGVQTAGGVGGAIAPTAMQQYGDIQDPAALLAGSLAGSIAGGRAGAASAERGAQLGAFARRKIEGADISPEALRTQARAAFDATDASGVTYEPTSFANFAATAEQTLVDMKYRPQSPRYPVVTDAINLIKKEVSKTQTISDLHGLRQDLNELSRGASADQGRMIGRLKEQLDNFITDPRNAVVADAKEVGPASQALMEAISDYHKLIKSNVVEGLIKKAERDTNRSFSDALQAKAKTLVNNDNKMRQFAPNERAAIEALASGAADYGSVSALRQFSPNTRSFNVTPQTAARLLVTGGLGGTGYATGSPELMMLGGGLAAAGAGARMARDFATSQRANALAAAMRRGDVRAPINANRMDMLLRGAPQALGQSNYFPE